MASTEVSLINHPNVLQAYHQQAKEAWLVCTWQESLNCEEFLLEGRQEGKQKIQEKECGETFLRNKGWFP